MTYTFQRSYVDENNKGFLKGSEASADFPKEKIEKLVASGILLAVEAPTDFLEGKVENADIESLDPDKRVKGKKG